jgi:hypothetical protein
MLRRLANDFDERARYIETVGSESRNAELLEGSQYRPWLALGAQNANTTARGMARKRNLSYRGAVR